MSILNRYNYDHQRAGFYFNTDPVCRSYHELSPEGKYLIFFNGANAPAQHVDMKDSESHTIDYLMYTLNSAIVHGTPRWGQRTAELLFENMLSAIVFMMPENALTRSTETKEDWRVALMAKVTQWCQNHHSFFIPIVA